MNDETAMGHDTESDNDATLGRRRLLRRAGTVAAGVVGAGAVGSVVASPAHAAPGEPLVEGDNPALTPTTFTGSDLPALLSIDNRFGSPLRLVPKETLVGLVEVGEVDVATDGTFVVKTEYGPELLATTLMTNQLVPVEPQRIVDTRTAAGRTRILNRSGNLDSSGRLLHGKTIHIDLAGLVNSGDALHGNVTVTAAANAGYLTIFPYNGTRRETSTLNYQSSRTQPSVANAFLVGIGSGAEIADAIAIYNYGGPAHVIVDATAFTITWGIGYVEAPTVGAASRAGASRAMRAARIAGDAARKSSPR